MESMRHHCINHELLRLTLQASNQSGATEPTFGHSGALSASGFRMLSTLKLSMLSSGFGQST